MMSNENFPQDLPYVQTVCGKISPDLLGPTLMHEHVLVDIRPPSMRNIAQIGKKITLENRFTCDYGEVWAPGNYVLNQQNIAINELEKMNLSGGKSIVELSCGGLNPNPKGLQKVSQKSQTNIIMGCGYYVEEYLDPKLHNYSQDDFAQEMIDQIQIGAWGTDIKAGIIGEIGCQSPWTKLEQTIMRGAIMAQKVTGAALSIHPGRNENQPQEIADFLMKNNADMSRNIMSHVDRTIFDDERLFKLADTGIIIEFDLFGMENSFYKLNLEIDMPNDAMRLKTIRKLIDRGHLKQILISHDICYQTRLCCNGGHGYGHIFRNVIPMMLRRNFTQDEIDTIIVENPKRLLTITPIPS